MRRPSARTWAWIGCQLIVAIVWAVVRFGHGMDGAADVGAILVSLALIHMRLARPPGQ